MKLFKILELSDLYADACIRDSTGELVFLSLYGRDTAINQLLAAFQLGDRDGGFSSIRILDEEAGIQHRVSVRRAESLTKFSGRLPKGKLLGNLVQTWIYDPCLVTPDRVSKTGWVLLDQSLGAEGARQHLIDRVWAMYQLLSPVPLLDSWKEVVLRASEEQCLNIMDSTEYPPIGRVSAVQVSLTDQFGEFVSRLVKQHAIGIAGEEEDFLDRSRNSLAEAA